MLNWAVSSERVREDIEEEAKIDLAQNGRPADDHGSGPQIKMPALLAVRDGRSLLIFTMDSL